MVDEWMSKYKCPPVRINALMTVARCCNVQLVGMPAYSS